MLLRRFFFLFSFQTTHTYSSAGDGSSSFLTLQRATLSCPSICFFGSLLRRLQPQRPRFPQESLRLRPLCVGVSEKRFTVAANIKRVPTTSKAEESLGLADAACRYKHAHTHRRSYTTARFRFVAYVWFLFFSFFWTVGLRVLLKVTHLQNLHLTPAYIFAYTSNNRHTRMQHGYQPGGGKKPTEINSIWSWTQKRSKSELRLKLSEAFLCGRKILFRILRPRWKNWVH